MCYVVGVYVPKQFALEDRDELLKFIRAEPFGVLVSAAGGVPAASHLPFVIRRGEVPVLQAHFARANPHWECVDGAEVLVIFQGPHAHISASWYADPAQNVPTWNYGAVHCRGRASIVSAERTHEILRAMTAEFERDWSMDVPPAEYIARMERGVVGVEIAIESIEGKLKYSQNRSAEDRERVVARLSESPHARYRETADAMRAVETVHKKV